MDSWSREHQQRHKRSFQEMSAEATISPSPFTFASRRPSIALDDNSQNYERRRTSHPHNQESRAFLSLDVMSQNIPPRQIPSLEHRTSQTVIDLTDDMEEGSTQGIRIPPPRLARSNAGGLADVIDLTADDDLQITAVRTVVAPQPLAHDRHRHRSPHLQPRLADHEGMFVPEGPSEPSHFDQVQSFPRFMAGINTRSMFDILGLTASRRSHHLQPMPGEVAFVIGQEPGVPAHLDYLNPAFGRPREAQKPQHISPPPAEEGFTRSPREDDILVCPGCDQELVASKIASEVIPAPKKNGKGPTKAELRQNPFWVVKECGHVYCNECFQNRKGKSRGSPPSNFPEIIIRIGNPQKTSRGCAVEGCKKDVGDKKNWVGVFL